MKNGKDNNVKGAVLLIGSLLWENEKNCLPDQKSLALKRRKWRHSCLNLNLKEITPLPIRYGRSSSSRIDTYTMVFSSSYIRKKGHGIIIPFKKTIDFLTGTNLQNQAKRLAIVEGICDQTGDRSTLIKNWGCIAIWINPQSKYKQEIKKMWSTIIQNVQFGYSKIRVSNFKWGDEDSLLLDDYSLDLKIKSDYDFLLCTYIIPKHKNIQKNSERVYPSPKEMSDAILASGYKTYFSKNRKNGIVTFDDKQILKRLSAKRIKSSK